MRRLGSGSVRPGRRRGCKHRRRRSGGDADAGTGDAEPDARPPALGCLIDGQIFDFCDSFDGPDASFVPPWDSVDVVWTVSVDGQSQVHTESPMVLPHMQSAMLYSGPSAVISPDVPGHAGWVVEIDDVRVGIKSR